MLQRLSGRATGSYAGAPYVRAVGRLVAGYRGELDGCDHSREGEMDRQRQGCVQVARQPPVPVRPLRMEALLVKEEEEDSLVY